MDATPSENSPEALVDALVKIAHQLPKSLLADFGLRLQEAGYMEIKSTTLMDAPPDDLLKSIPLDPMRTVDLQRLYRALAIFAEYYIGLETIIWRTWQELAPTSPVKRDPTPMGDVKKVSARYLHGDSEVSSEQLRQIVERTRKVMGGLLGAIPAGGAAFLERFLSEFATGQNRRPRKGRQEPRRLDRGREELEQIQEDGGGSGGPGLRRENVRGHRAES